MGTVEAKALRRKVPKLEYTKQIMKNQRTIKIIHNDILAYADDVVTSVTKIITRKVNKHVHKIREGRSDSRVYRRDEENTAYC